MHIKNAAKYAIITCKNHFISGLSKTGPDFPIREWNQLIPQCLITFNLLPNSIFNPDFSVYTYLFVPYDFNKYTTSPPGTRVIVHNKPGNHT